MPIPGLGHTSPRNRFSLVRPPGLVFYADLWHPEQQGFALNYDGSTGYLTNATADFRSGDSQGGIGFWFRTTATSSIHTILSSNDTATALSYNFELRVGNTLGKVGLRQINNDTADVCDGGISVNDGEWHYGYLASNGTAWLLYIDGVLDTLTFSSGSNTGDWFADTTLRDAISIGCALRTSATNFFNGNIGAVTIYSQPLTADEIQTNHSRGRKGETVNTTNLVFNLPCTEGTGNPVDTVGSLTMTRTGTTTWIESLTDRSTNAVVISSVGSPTWSNQGRTLALNKYLHATATALNFTTSDFSAWAWVKSTDLTANNYIFSRGLASTDGWGFYVTSAGAITFVTNQAAATQTSFSANSAILADTWYMLGFSRSGATGKVWKNAVDVTGTSGSHTNPLTSTRTLKIGAYDDLTLALIGTMGESGVNGRALSAGEFNQIFNATRWRYGVRS